MRRLVRTSVALLLAMVGIATVWPSPAQAGEAGGNGRLIAAIYNDSPFPLQYVGGWSQYGFHQTPTSVAVEDSSVFEITGSPEKLNGYPCWYHRNTYNGWFTYKVTVAHTGGATEYVTMSIHGERAYSGNGFCTFADSQPTIEVWQTSTPPPSTWRHTDGAPPNVLADPQFGYRHNVPSLFDQTITWDGEGPGDGVPTVVSLGDSTISGEGGRWAGNTNVINGQDDAGSTWYWDTPTGESIQGCHRSKSALVHIGAGFRSHNFACSAAMTNTYNWEYPQGWRFKPGVDMYCGGNLGIATLDCPAGLGMGQLNELYHYARTHNVKHVVLAVGANDFDFSGVVQTCTKIYEAQHLFDTGRRCYNSGAIQNAVSETNRANIEAKIVNSLNALVSTMKAAGYDPTMYSVIMLNYWSPLPSDEDIRIPDHMYRRQSEGGCPILDPDATVLNEYLLPAINGSVLKVAKMFRSSAGNPPLRFMDVSEALRGHRLCERGVGLLEDIPSSVYGFRGRGTDPGAADKVEWVTEARTATVIGTDYTLAEGGHANYWGQLALRNCLRQMVTLHMPRGKCVPAGGVSTLKEPNMTLTHVPW